MDIVLGVALAPDSVRIVLLQGESADGATIDENEFALSGGDSPTISASDRAVAAIVGTRDDANGAGITLSSVGVACTDQLEAAALRDALTAHKVENVMLVSAFVAAAALAQSIGTARGYDSMAMLLVEPDLATLAIVETSDGSVTDVRTAPLHGPDVLADMVAGLDNGEAHPGGLTIIGHGVDVAAIKSGLQEATALTVSAPEEPETALARGAALASAHVLTSPTAALAYAQDPGTGALDVSALPEYLSVGDAEHGDVAYSAVADDGAAAPTVVLAHVESAESPRRPGLLVGAIIAVAGFSAALALEVALTVGAHTTVGLLPAPLHNFVAPAEQIFAPVPGPVAVTKAVAPPSAAPLAVVPPPASSVPNPPAVAVPAVPVPAVPVPLVAPPLGSLPAPLAPLPPIQMPEPPASQPIMQAPPPHVPPPNSPPTHVPPPNSPPPPGHGPGHDPGGTGGGPSGTPGGPATGPGHGAPGGGGPHEGAPGGAPHEGAPGGAPGGGSGGGEPPGSGGSSSGGTDSGGGSHGGGTSTGGGSAGGAETGGGSGVGSSSGGGAESGGGSSAGGAESGGHH